MRGIGSFEFAADDTDPNCCSPDCPHRRVLPQTSDDYPYWECLIFGALAENSDEEPLRAPGCSAAEKHEKERTAKWNPVWWNTDKIACSKCDYRTFTEYGFYPHCPGCGLKMEEG